MSGRAKLEALADAALEAARGATAVEVVAGWRAGAVTRFADTQVHQNTASEQWDISVRAVLGDGRTGVAAITSSDSADAAVASRRAVALAQLAPPDPEFAGVARPAEPSPAWYDEATAACTPADRAALVRAIAAEVGGLSAAGAVRTDLVERCIRTSAGADLYAASTRAGLNLVVTGSSSSGHAEDGSHALGEISAGASARRAVAKAKAGTDPHPVEAGVWPVVLEPSAVASLVLYLGFLGFNAKSVAEGRSFVSGRLGEAAVDEQLTLVDDALHPQARGFPFDSEGTPKQRVEMIRDGRINAVVHDRRSAAGVGTVSTGHALTAPNPLGPIPLDAFVVPGDGGAVEDLVARTERGLLITRFHYVNVVHPLETVITGMTRDGTFLVEDGEIVRPVRNLRFTQSILAALARIEAIGSDTGFGTEILGDGARQPPLALPRFQFTGLTDFG